VDILSIIGIALGMFAVFGGALLEGIHLSAIMIPTAALIVFGGTIGAVLLQSSSEEVACLKKTLPEIFKPIKVDGPGVAAEIVELSKIARRDGMLALDEKVKGLDNKFLAKGIALLIDGVAANEIRNRLEMVLAKKEEEYQGGARVWEAGGGYAPTVGILGAVLGLIHVMGNLDDPSKLGPGIAVAFVATVYGVGSANLICLPFAGKLKARMRAGAAAGEIVLEGVCAMAEGQPTSAIEQTLEMMLGDEAGDGEAKADAEAA